MIIFLLILLFSLQFCTENNRNDRNVLCYSILKIDKEYGIDAGETEYKFLDKLLEIAEQNIHPKRNYSLEDAIGILNEIAEIHKNLGIITPLRNTGEPFSIALKEKSFDCGNYVITYISIAQKLNLPLHAVIAPEHIFLEWNDGKNCFFWETLYNIVKPKEAYIIDHFIPEKTIKDGIYLTQINIEKLKANYYNTLATYFIFEKNDLNRSYNCLINGFKKDTLLPSILSNFGNYYMKNGNDSMMLHYYSKSLIINPNLYSTYLNRGVYYINVKKYKEALNDLKKALTVTKDSINKSNSYFNIGIVYKTIGDLSKAKIMYDSAIIFNLMDDKVYNDRAYCYFQLSKFDSALEDYNLAIKLNPKYSLYYSNRALTKIKIVDSSSALVDLNKAITLDKNNFIAIRNRAKLYFDKMDYKSALTDLNFAIELDSNVSALYYYRAISNNVVGNTANVNRDYNKYISMLKSQNNEDYYEEIIWFQLILKKFNKAIYCSKIATTKFPKSYYLKSYLADAYLLDGQYEKAIEIYLKYRKKKFDGTTWRENVADDFEQLKKYKINIPEMNSILLLLK